MRTVPSSSNRNRVGYACLLFAALVVEAATGSSCSKGRPPIQVEKPAFVAGSIVNFRNGPNAGAARLGAFPLGERVLVLQKSAQAEKIGDDEGHWFEVQSGSRKGWVFGPFLSATPVGSLAELQQRFRGNYYNCTDASGKDCRRLIQITGSSYRQDWFNPKGAMSDQFRGDVVYGAEYVKLVPRSRASLPADYGNPYGYGYGNGGRGGLAAMGLPLEMGNATLYFKQCDEKVHLTPKSSDSCGATTDVYVRR